MINLPYRQVHLDFHTSPYIRDVGGEFNPEEFVEILKNAHVNGINVFAKCHHGMSYYPTKYGKQHPSYQGDLLGDMLNVLNRENIIPNVYFPIGWEETSADNEAWLEVSPEGVLGGKSPFEDKYYSWRKLCLNNKEYRSFIKDQVREIMTSYEFAGFWFDIIFQEQCLCKTCMMELQTLGWDPKNEKKRKKHDFLVLQDFQKELYDYVKSIDETKTIFFNGAWVPDGGYEEECNIEKRGIYQTHIEVESLPSELWGYNLFPLYVNYHNRHNANCIGMNGKFHNAWGDFGSLRNQEALEFECFRMIMNGSKCSIGDQLHPRGALDKSTYSRIGNVYEQIKSREEWCVDDQKVSEIGIIMAHKAFETEMLADEGALRMMLELKQQFDFLDWQDNFSKYRLIILPDYVHFNMERARKISDYIKQGGKVIATHESGLEKDSHKYLLEEANINYLGESEYTPMYLDITSKFSETIDALQYALYEKGSKVLAKNKEQVKAYLGKPYFNRSYDCFCSHRQFPYDCLVEDAGIVESSSVVYISHPIFTDYITNGVRVYRDLVEQSIASLIGATMIITNLPSSAEVTVRRQANRLIIHMSHYIAEKKSKRLEVIDTKLSLHHITMKAKTDHKPSKLYLAPSLTPLEGVYEDGYISVTIPELFGHQMLVLED
jgi:hypothetical protein